MKISKQLLTIGVPVAIGLLIILDSDLSFAKEVDMDAIENQVKWYLSSDKFDLFGRRFDKEHFDMIRQYAGKNPFKLIYADIKTIGLQWKVFDKVMKENSGLYLMFGGSYGFKYVPDHEKVKLFNMFMKIIFK